MAPLPPDKEPLGRARLGTEAWDGPASGYLFGALACGVARHLSFLFFTLVTGSLSLKLSDTRVHEPQIRARLGTCVEPLPAASHGTSLRSPSEFTEKHDRRGVGGGGGGSSSSTS